MPTDPDALFTIAKRVAACPHLGTCRAEMAFNGKALPLDLPSPDYVGPRYRGLVIIGGNPGIAHAGIHHANDARMFELQGKIAKGDEDAFSELMEFLPESMAHWPQMVNLDGRNRMAYDIEEIAYIDIVKCASRPLGSNLLGLFRGTDILARCWEIHTAPLLRHLQPTHIVALWQPIVPTLQRLGYLFPDGAIIGSYSGNQSYTWDQRYAGAKPVFDAYYDRE